MWNEPTPEDLRKIPHLFETEDVLLKNKVIYEHFFLGGCDWYVAEYSPQERLFFGYAILNDDLDNAEWGYISYDELREIRTRQGMEIDRDLHWTPRPVRDIDRIRRSV